MGLFTQIDIHHAKELIDTKDVTVVDIRDSGTFDEEHIKSAVLVSDNNIEEFLKAADKKRPLLCYCYHGISSQAAAEYFAHNGFEEVYSMEGGFEKWKTVYPFVQSL